jgi:Zn-dependent protease with chaperone function
MRLSRRQLAIGGVCAAAMGGTPFRARADSFTISGKKGPFVKQVAGRNLGWTPGQGGSLGLASDAVNQGQYQQGRLRMPATEAAVAALIGRLESQWPYAKGPPPKVIIIGVDYYNAYSLPDNSIAVSFGMLNHAGSDDEVAFVLGHERSHLLLGHFGDRGGAAGDTGLASRLGQAFVVSAALGAAGAAGGTAGAAAIAARNAGATSDMLHFLSGVTAEPAHTRAQEDEADAMGFDLSQAAGWSAEDASAVVFDTIQADKDRRKATMDALQQQLKSDLGVAISRDAANSFLSGGLSTSNLQAGLLSGGLRLAAGAAAARGEGPQHRPPAERKKGIAQYSADAYPAGAPLRDEQHVWLQQVRSTPEFAQAKIAVEAVGAAMKARAAGDYPGATTQINLALATSFASTPLVLCEAARLHEDMGDTAGADRLFSRADASPDQTVDGAVDHGRMLFQAGQNDRALQLIQASIVRFGNDNKPFLPLLIAVSRQSGREDAADQYLQQCLAYNDPDLKHDCELAAGKQAEPAKPAAHPLPFGLPHL